MYYVNVNTDRGTVFVSQEGQEVRGFKFPAADMAENFAADVHRSPVEMAELAWQWGGYEF